jgi:hypothetical protein
VPWDEDDLNELDNISGDGVPLKRGQRNDSAKTYRYMWVGIAARALYQRTFDAVVISQTANRQQTPIRRLPWFTPTYVRLRVQ